MASYFPVCIALVLAFVCHVNGLVFPSTDFNTTLPTRDMYQFPNETWVENLAVRQNGQILVTVHTAPELYLVDPFHANSSPVLVHRIPDVIGLLGIVEVQHDMFYVIAGNRSVATLETAPGSYSIWKID